MEEKDLILTQEELKKLHKIMVDYELDNELEDSATPYDEFVYGILLKGDLSVMISDNEDDLLVGSLAVGYNLVEGFIETDLEISSTTESENAIICNLEDTVEPYQFEKIDPETNHKIVSTLTVKDKELIVNVKEYLTADEIINMCDGSDWDGYYSMANDYFNDIQSLIEEDEDSLENLLALLKKFK